MLRRLSARVVESCLPLVIGLTAAAPGGAREGQVSAAPDMVRLPAGRVVLVIHGVADDGAEWSSRFKRQLMRSPYGDSRQEVYLFRWAQPDGTAPALCHARSSLAGLSIRCPDAPAKETLYQLDEARRLRDFLVGARELYRDYGLDGRIDIVAHSQGTLITLEALHQGGEADNVVFMGSPLSYTCDRQDDVIGALPHVRGVLYNYYTPGDAPVRFMGGGLFREPCGWPEKDLPRDKVVQVKADVQGHTGYYTEDAIRANYLDKLGTRGEGGCRIAADRAAEFMEKWRKLTADAGLIDRE